MKKIISIFLFILIILQNTGLSNSNAAEICVLNAKTVSISFNEEYILATKGETKASELKFIEELNDFTSREITGEQCQWSFDDPNIAQYRNGGIEICGAGITTATVRKNDAFTKVLFVARENRNENFVIYNEDFNGLADGTIPEGWMRKEGFTASKIGVKNGAFEIDARTSPDNPTRILLPDYLDYFGNYSIEADISNLESNDGTRWNSLMYRIQNSDYPYYQMAVRKDAAAISGVEIAERTGVDGWNVIKASFFKESINESKMNHYTVKAYSNMIQEWINNIPLIESELSDSCYLKGGIGIQANGSIMRIDNIKITLLDVPMPAIIKPEDKYSRVVEADTKIAMAPTVITEIESREDFDRIISQGLAATAVLTVNKNLEVLGNFSKNVIGTVASMYEAMKSRVIPAFRVNDEEAANAVAKYLKKNMIEDVFVISNNPELVRLARESYTFIRGIVEFDNLSSEASTNELMNVRNTINSNLSRIAVIPAHSATKYNIQFLQQRLVTVWSKEKITGDTSDKKLITLHGIITAGANGIITSSPEKARQALAIYSHDTTIVRKPFLIGHRGVPDLAPENTIEGCELAFRLGADIVENDIYPTKTGEDGNQYLVIMHDEDISRTTNGAGKVFEKTLKELETYLVNKQFPVEYPLAKIPTLNQYFEKFTGKDQVIFVEIKSYDKVLIDKYTDIIRKTGYDSHLVTISFSADQLRSMRTEVPEMSLGYLSGGIANESDAYASLRAALWQVQMLNSSFMPSYSTLEKGFLEISKHRGMTIWPWTFTDKSMIIKYFKMGACGLTANCSQYFSDWASDIAAKQTQFTIKLGESVLLNADVKTYKGDIKEVVPDVVVLTGGDKLQVRGNSITAIKEGEAYVTLRHNAKLSDGEGDTYDIYTQPVKIQVQNFDTNITPYIKYYPN
jgi:glycerophosphoryl diester phosphodiesterase